MAGLLIEGQVCWPTFAGLFVKPIRQMNAKGSSHFDETFQGEQERAAREIQQRNLPDSLMKLSVIIASCNRAGYLLHFLRELTRQVVPEHISWEALIVDNNSTDHTRELIAPLIAQNPQKFRYLLESRRGKSLALNTGIHAASGDILVFTDDDCVPDPYWLASIAREFGADSSLAAIGGRVELLYHQDKPVSIRTCREKTLVTTTNQLFSLLIGCNMAMRRKVCELVNEFDPYLGPGTRLPAMEDLDFLYRVFKRHLKIVYSPDALVYHNHGRRTKADVQVLNRKYVVGRGAFYCKHILAEDPNVLKMAYWEVSSMLKCLVKDLFAGRKFKEDFMLLWALFAGAVGRLAWSFRVHRA